MGLHIRDYELEDLVVLALFPCFALGWVIGAFGIGMTLDLDQSWFDPDRVAFLLLALRITTFWPVWSTVQLEQLLTSPGEVAGAWLLLLPVVTTVIPVFAIGLIWTRRGIATRR